MPRSGRTSRCRKRKSDKSTHVIDRATVYIRLSQWLKKNCQRRWSPSLFPALFAGTGRGLITKRRIQSGDILISIPHFLLITTELVLSSNIGDILHRHQSRLTSQQLLSLFLLIERDKGEKSFWYPYIAVLPVTYSTPVFFNRREKDLLPNHLKIACKIKESHLKACFTEVQELCKRESFTILYEEFVWAWNTVNTRCVFYKTKLPSSVIEDENHIALAPYLDLLNHSSTAQVEAGYNESTKQYEIKTKDTYKKYQQVFISYGSHDNSYLLMEYGFTLPNNPNDAVRIHYDDVQLALRSLKIQFIEKKNSLIFANNLNKKWNCTIEGLSWNMMIALRIYAMSWTELEKVKLALHGNIVSAQNEEISKSIAKIILKKYIKENKISSSKFPTTMSEHEKLIHNIVRSEHDILQATWISIT